jgi:hypothetical protein
MYIVRCLAHATIIIRKYYVEVYSKTNICSCDGKLHGIMFLCYDSLTVTSEHLLWMFGYAYISMFYNEFLAAGFSYA